MSTESVTVTEANQGFRRQSNHNPDDEEIFPLRREGQNFIISLAWIQIISFHC